MIKDFFEYIWDWAKRIFGRSKTIFTSVVGMLTASWVELYDPISIFNWDDIVSKHEVAIAIGVGVQVLNVFFKMFADNGAASFRALSHDEPGQIFEEAEDEEIPEPKVE